MSNVAYIRVSSASQNTARQFDGYDVAGWKIFEEKVSAKSVEGRAQLSACLEFCREGDVLHVWSIDRLARNLAELQTLVKGLTARGVVVKFEKEQLTFTGDKENATSDLMLSMLGAFAQFERALMIERQREGIQAARNAGKHVGRPGALTDAQIIDVKKRIANGEKKNALATEYGVSRPTIYAAIAA